MAPGRSGPAGRLAPTTPAGAVAVPPVVTPPDAARCSAQAPAGASPATTRPADAATAAIDYGPGSRVFDHADGAERIVFVCDATGTMISKMDSQRRELAKAIAALKPAQSFNVIFYYDGPKATSFEPAPVVASQENKDRVARWLAGVNPAGQTDPLPALRLAFGQRPQLVFLLSDGELNCLLSYKEIVDHVHRLNPDNSIKLNTILFETYDKEAEDVLHGMAKDTGGHFRYVREADLTEK